MGTQPRLDRLESAEFTEGDDNGDGKAVSRGEDEIMVGVGL